MGKNLTTRMQIKIFKVDKKLKILIKIFLRKYINKLLIFHKQINIQSEILIKWNQMVFISKCIFITSFKKRLLFITKSTCQYILAKSILFHTQQLYNMQEKILKRIYILVLNRIKNMKSTSKNSLKNKICFKILNHKKKKKFVKYFKANF